MIFMKWLRRLVLGFVGLFSAYGALASLEPTETSSIHLGWLIFYLTVFSVVMAFLIRDVVTMWRCR